MPGRIDGKARAGDYPIVTTRHLGLPHQLHSCLRQVMIGLANVAGPATGDDVFPGVHSALRPRYDVV